MGKSSVYRNMEQGLLAASSKLSAHTAPRIPKIQKKKTPKRKRRIFLQQVESYLGWALQYLPLLGKCCLLSQCQYFSLQPEGGMD